MRKILTLLFVLVALAGQAKEKTIVWEELAVGYSPNPQFMITKVEFSKEKTTLYAVYQNPPDGWFRISKESYLQSDGKTYAIVGSDSIALDEECYTNEDTWTREFVLYFKPLPLDTKEFDFLEGTTLNDFKVFNIHEESYTMPVTPVPDEYKADYAEEDVLAEMKYSDEPATIHFKAMNYRKGMNTEVQVQYVDLKNPAAPVDVKVRLDDNGEATLHLPICFPQPVYPSLFNIPWASTCGLYLAPGKEVTVLIDMLHDDSEANSKFVGFKGYFAKFDKEWYALRVEVEEEQEKEKDKFPKWKEIHDVSTLMDAFDTELAYNVDILKRFSCSKTLMDYMVSLWHIPPVFLKNFVPDSLLSSKEFTDYILQHFTKDLYSPTATFSYGFVRGSKYYVMLDARGINADLARYCYYLPQVLDGKDVPKPLIEDKNLSDLYDKYVEEYKRSVASNKEKVTGNEHIHYLDMKEVAPDKVLSTILDRYKGKTVLIDIWATWCGPCRVAIDQMKPMKQELEGKDIVYIYMTSSTSEFDTWKELIPDIHGEHYYLTEEQLNHILQQYGEQAYPTYAIYNRKGERTYLTTGFPGVEAMKKELEKATK
ncbi:MAG: TlpA disulfide reductase family protein [Bacteroidales bacterium]|nr:TlpA disulfide reductase family protein [Bacteroidales bacterium]